MSLVPGTGNFHFSAKTSFAVENEGQAEQVRQFTELLTRAGGFTPRIKIDSRKGDVCLVTDATLKSEAYKLEITIKKITIRASDLQGFYYALQSIRQLLPSAIESEQVDGECRLELFPGTDYHRPTPFQVMGTYSR